MRNLQKYKYIVLRSLTAAILLERTKISENNKRSEMIHITICLHIMKSDLFLLKNTGKIKIRQVIRSRNISNHTLIRNSSYRKRKDEINKIYEISNNSIHFNRRGSVKTL